MALSACRLVLPEAPSNANCESERSVVEPLQLPFPGHFDTTIYLETLRHSVRVITGTVDGFWMQRCRRWRNVGRRDGWHVVQTIGIRCLIAMNTAEDERDPVQSMQKTSETGM